MDREKVLISIDNRNLGLCSPLRMNAEDGEGPVSQTDEIIVGCNLKKKKRKGNTGRSLVMSLLSIDNNNCLTWL